MLTLFGPRTPAHTRDGQNRRNFLSVGTLALGGLSLADLLRGDARGATGATTQKSIIMVYLPGGPSHIDLYDMKPDAPVEIRGEFKHVRSNVPGIDLCELMPKQATIADKLSIIRGFKTSGGHEGHTITTGFGPRAQRPAFGSVVSRMLPNRGAGLPAYVTLVQESNLPFGEEPTYLGPAHKPFALRGRGMADLTLSRDMTLDRLGERKELLRSFDTLRQDLDARGYMNGMDAHTARALEMVSSTKAREAFDLNREPERVRAKYGKSPSMQQFLLARRLVEAGVRIVTLCGGWGEDGQGGSGSASSLGNWDTHGDNFSRLRIQAPRLDHALHTLITDLHDRGLGKDVVVVACGEMGRSPRVGKPNDGGGATASGRDHWDTGFALVSGGGLQMGQVVGETDRHGARAKGKPSTPQNLLATLYHLLEIDPAMTFLDHSGRPQYLVDDQEKIAQLL